MKIRHPHQPTQMYGGVRRFKSNEIVRYLLDVCRDKGMADMNSLATIPFSDEDRVQFAQFIGYSVDGFCDLSYVSKKVRDEVTK